MTVIGNSPKIPKEKQGGVPVNLQDQITRPIIAKFNKVTNSTTLSGVATKGAYTIDVVSATGISAGSLITLFDPTSANFSFYKALSVATLEITLDSPVDFAYPNGTFVDVSITNMNVDGSSTAQTFGLRGIGSPPGVDITVDITKIIIQCQTATAVDLEKFGDLTALTRGLLLRRRDSIIENIFNVKTNDEISGIMEFEPITSTNPAQGVDGFRAELTFAGQNQIGVAIRLPLGEDLEVLIQDSLLGLTSLEMTAEGHITTD